MKTEKVKWTAREKGVLIAEGARLLATKAAKSRTEAWNLAVAKFPEWRYRKITGLMSGSGWFAAGLRSTKAGTPVANQDAKRRVYWTADERKMLIEHAAQAIASGSAKTSIQAMRAAQMALPESRRRTSFLLSQMPWFKPADRARKIALREARASELVTEPAAAAAQPAQALNGHASLQTPPVANASTLTPPATPWEALPLTQLRRGLVDMLSDVFLEAMQLAVSRLAAPSSSSEASRQQHVEPAKQHDPRVTQQTKTHQPAILVAGLKGAQKSLIEMEFGDRLDLRFYSSDESKDQLRKMADAAEATLAVTDFLSHAHTDIIASRSSNYQPCSGGMTTLRTALSKFIPKGAAS